MLPINFYHFTASNVRTYFCKNTSRTIIDYFEIDTEQGRIFPECKRTMIFNEITIEGKNVELNKQGN